MLNLTIYMKWFLFGAIAAAVLLDLGERGVSVLTSLDEPSTGGSDFVRRHPLGYEDRIESGNEAALRDLETNNVKFGIFGRVVDDSLFKAYEKFNVKPVWLGCDVAGPGSAFWKGYNETVALEMLRRHPNATSAGLWRINEGL